MAKTTRLKEEFMISQKENSPPCILEGSLPGSGGQGLKTIAHSNTGIRNNNNQSDIQLEQIGQNRRLLPVDEMIDNNGNGGYPQPLKSSNALGVAQVQKGKDQAKLLHKFRQLRQWQQQQQDNMTKQQEEQLETIKIQQDRLQMLYAKAVNSGIAKDLGGATGSPTGSLTGNENVNLNACQRFGASQFMPSSNQFIPATYSDAQLSPIPRVVSCQSTPGYSEQLSTGRHVHPVLMSPQHFVATTSGMNQLTRSRNFSPDAVSPRISSIHSPLSNLNGPMYSAWKSPDSQLIPGHSEGLSPLSSAAFQLPIPHLQMPHQVTLGGPGHMTLEIPGNSTTIPGRQQLRVFQESVDLQSDLDSQSDLQSEVDTMSGVYPLHDADSHVGSDDGAEPGRETRDQDLSDEEMSDEENMSEYQKTIIEAQPHQETPVKEEASQNIENEEDRPITPGIGLSSAKTFEELLEHQLKIEESQQGMPTSPSPVKPRTFLRKGQGLARFRMQPKTKPANQAKKGQVLSQAKGNPQAKEMVKKPTAPPTNRGSSQVAPTRESTRKGIASQVVPQGKVTRKVAGKVTPQAVHSPVDVPDSQGFGTSTLASRVIGPFSAMSHGLPHTMTTAALTKTLINTGRSSPLPYRSPVHLRVHSSIDESFQRMKLGWDKEEKVEDDELEEFEMLEQAAANASFSSNSSVVVRVLEKARGKGHAPPIRNNQVMTLNRDAPVGVPSIVSPVDTGYASSDGRVPGDVTSRTASERDDQLSQDGRCYEVEEEEEVDSDEESSDGDVTLHEMSLDSALHEEHTTLPVMHRQETAAFTTEKVTSNQPFATSSSSVTSSDDFDDEEAWGEIKAQAGWTGDESDRDSDDSDDTVMDVNTIINSTPPLLRKPRDEHVTQAKPGSEADVTSTPPTSSLVSKLFPQLKPKPKVVEPPNNPEVLSNQAANVVEQGEGGLSNVVQDKLQELEQEISKFRAENKALAKIRDEREQGLKRLQVEITSFEKQKSDELERVEKFREEETQKLRRERRVFEKYQKTTRANPDKKEREEIEALRSQVTEMQDEMKRRESRWSAASARYRNRIEALEEQSKELQDEVKLLEKYRLDRWRSEQTKASKENEEARSRKETNRKTSRPVESEESSKLMAPDRPQPRQPVVMETITRPPEQQALSPLERARVAVMDANNNNTETVSVPRSYEREKLDTTVGSTTLTAPVKSFSPNRSVQTHGQTSAVPPPEANKRRRSVHFDETDSCPGQHSDVNVGKDLPDLKNSKMDHTDMLGGRMDRADMMDGRVQEIAHPDGKVEQVQADGSRVILFANGTRREISGDGKTIIVTFFNGDIKQMMPDQRVVYYYSEAKTTHTTYPDGLEVLQFPNNQIEKHYVDGTKEIIFPDQTVKYLFTNGTEECVFADGTVQRVSGDERTIEFANGQREIHTKYYKKREYPNGTVKTVFQDGRTETRYSNGRMRVRDKEGRVMVDTADQSR